MSIFSLPTEATVRSLPKIERLDEMKSPMMKARRATPMTTISKTDFCLIFSNVAIYSNVIYFFSKKASRAVRQAAQTSTLYF